MGYDLYVNSEDCVGCYACEVACKQEHNLPIGPRLIRVYPEDPQIIDSRLQLRYRVEHCMHCNPPLCQESCAVGAISIRKDGIAVVIKDICTGCQQCIESCPHGMVEFDDVKKIAWKCDLCTDRLDLGLQPACVAACPSHCIYFGDISKIKRKLGKSKLPRWYQKDAVSQTDKTPEK